VSARPAPVADERVFTVSEVTRDLRLVVERAFPALWVEGEVSNFTHHSSGHMYFTLKDEQAQLPAVFFKTRAARLRFRLENGLLVRAFGQLTLYEKRGAYQIVVDDVVPAGMGALELALAQLRERLAKEGLFDAARKRRLPAFPRAVGIVTSPTGAVVHDIRRVVLRRFPSVPLVLAPVRVQGEGAADEIARGIEMMNAWGGVDLLIVGRGGGSLEDLWAFNEERVVRAIVASRIPVVSAVGHEVDVTLADLAADVRAPTPSAAAELAVPLRAQVAERLAAGARALSRALVRSVDARRERLARLSRSYGLRAPAHRVREAIQTLDDARRRIAAAARAPLERRAAALAASAARLQALSPLAVLERGYAVVRREPGGAVVRDAAGLAPGDRIAVRFARGGCRAEVREAWPDGEERPRVG
jgi:exodeoxyribonuclease VII large subunit